jgi:hypothetical protein
MNDYESMAMWRLYLTPPEGVAVRSTYWRLIDSSAVRWQHKGRNKGNMGKELRIHVGVVHYVDYQSPDSYPTDTMLRKPKSFEREREIRAVLRALPRISSCRAPGTRS